MLLSIIVPVYNEAKTFPKIIEYIQSIKYPIPHEVIVIDDASTDMPDYRAPGNVRFFKNPVNRGKGFSIRKGIEEARGDILIIQDADYEYDPADIPRLIEPLIRGESSVVYGSRFLNARRPDGMAFLNWIANRFLTALTNSLYGLHLTDMETCYKAFKAGTLKTLSLRTNRFTFEPEVTALLAKKGVPIRELPIGYRGRNPQEGKKIKARDFFYALLVLIGYRLGLKPPLKYPL